MPYIRMVDARWVCLALEQLDAARIPIDPILKKARLSRRQTGDPDAQIPFHKHANLLTLAAEATKDACFGLRLATEVGPKQAGILGYILLNSSTLGDALRNLQGYYRALTEGVYIDFKIDGQEAAVVVRIVDPLVEDERQAAEFGLSLLLHFCDLITGTKIVPLRVEFFHSKPKEAHTVRDRFGAAVRYRQNQTALVLRRDLLDHPITGADNELLKILERHCRQVLGREPRGQDIVYETRELVATHLPTGETKIDDIARQMGMGSRTLMRRLAEQDVSYKGLVDDVRRRLALRYLNDRHIRTKQIVYLLGYSESAAFNHAFRRWTGVSPREYRQRGFVGLKRLGPERGVS